ADFLLGDYSPTSDTVLLTEQRHYDGLMACRHNLESFMRAMDNGMPLECLVLEIREALYHLGQISGETTTDDVLEGIFSRFCIGK
ncbi:MAG: tRNA uridine-5-carboxymethylaminomethyl(34) synthesis GTPase MnmE, partial [Deltaproteobacteria bacterium]|nr:tRNA uridine-5-carboxymethylaminomethyl(34) synthesis GTPase MnmE [Deltaproteobacteria bacterium]